MRACLKIFLIFLNDKVTTVNMREVVAAEEYGLLAGKYARRIRDNNTLWLDFRKELSKEQRRIHRGDKSICIADELFDLVIGYFNLNRELMDSVDGMVSTAALSHEFGKRTTKDLEEELGASLAPQGRYCEFMYAVHEIAMALRRNELEFDVMQERRYIEIKNALEIIFENSKVSSVNFDFFVRGLVCAETIGPTALYTNDRALTALLPSTEALISRGKIKLVHPLDFYSTAGLFKRKGEGVKRTIYEKDYSLLPVPQEEVA